MVVVPVWYLCSTQFPPDWDVTDIGMEGPVVIGLALTRANRPGELALQSHGAKDELRAGRAGTRRPPLDPPQTRRELVSSPLRARHTTALIALLAKCRGIGFPRIGCVRLSWAAGRHCSHRSVAEGTASSSFTLLISSMTAANSRFASRVSYTG